jgi:Flp pilus assembly protein TadD
VLPGGEELIAEDAAVYRAIRRPQFDAPDEPVEMALRSLHDLYEGGGESPEVAYWLVAGYMATHRISTARVYVEDARGLFPQDPRLMVLDAILSHTDGDFDRAEGLLRSARVGRPDDPVVLFDLAIVLRDRQKTTEANQLLAHVRDRHEGSPIANRAGLLLEQTR